VSADPGFVEAWRYLSSTLASLYTNGTPDPAFATRAREAAERAIALAPNGPHGHAAMASYHRLVSRDMRAAETSVQKALAALPNDALLLRAAALIAQSRGDWNSALAKLQASQQLDPRSPNAAYALQAALLWLRRYPEALAASDAALAVAPGDLARVHNRAMIFLAQGDLAGARATMAHISPAFTPMEVAAHFGWSWDTYWVPDEQGQQLLATSRESDYPDREAWATVLMQLYAMRGDSARARAYADTALVANTEILKGAPNDAQRIMFRGLELAYLGRRAEAVAAVERSRSLAPIDGDHTVGPYYQQLAARAYLALGDQERALDLLEPLLKVPYFLSPGWLRIDPSFAALRGNPRFKRMTAGV
jgi:tetratricopeptide (TPR) repeat protein